MIVCACKTYIINMNKGGDRFMQKFIVSLKDRLNLNKDSFVFPSFAKRQQHMP